MKKFLSIPFIFAISACSSNMDDLVTFTKEVKQNTTVNIEPYPEFAELPKVDYHSSALRSPFERSKKRREQTQKLVSKNCRQPNYTRPKHTLEQYGLDALNMSGMFTSNNEKFAIVQANDGTLHKVTVGSYLGLFNGKVTKVNNSEIVINELLPDGAGCYRQKQTRLALNSNAGGQNDV